MKFFLDNLIYIRILVWFGLLVAFPHPITFIWLVTDFAISSTCMLVGRLIPIKFSHQPYSAFTFIPFVFYKKEMSEWLKNHEKIHSHQQIELGVSLFFSIYFGEFLYYYVKFREFDLAYRSISFEREAYGTL